MKNLQKKERFNVVLMVIFALVFCLSLLVFVKQVIRINQSPYQDFPIFYSAVQQYVETGAFYTHQLEDYYPASGIYKFPALYGSFLLPLVKNQVPLGTAQTVLLCLHVVLYFASVMMLVLLFLPEKNRVLYGLLSGILSLNLYALTETLHTLQLEIYILFFTTLILWLLNRQRYFYSGAALAFIAFLKVYPVFMGLFFLWKRTAAFFAGFILMAVLVLAGMIACFGLAENQWYFFSALPLMLQEGAFINHHNIGVEKLINHLFSTHQFIHYETAMGVGSAAITKIILWTCYLLGLWGFFRAGNMRGSRATHPHYMAFSLLLTLVLLTLKNPWSNYQILLIVPLLYILSHLFVSARSKILVALSGVAYLLLFLSPRHDSIFFTNFSGVANPVLMMVLGVLSDKLFALRGMATILLYIALLLLLFRNGKAAE